MTRSRILIALPMADDLVDRIRKDFDVVQFADSSVLPTADELSKALATVDGVITTTRLRYDAELFKACPRLKVIANYGVGFDNIDADAATQAGILVCNTLGAPDRAVAEIAIGLIIMVGRNMLANDQYVRSDAWLQGAAPLSSDIRGKVLGLLGMGRIGRAVAHIAHSLGMEIIYHNRKPDSSSEIAKIARYCSREQLFAESDFLSVHIPLDDSTRNSIGARELSSMKPSACFINTARGGVVVESELIQALKDGTIAGAGLDVMAHEPIGGDHPLCALPNVVLQPHIGSATNETRRAMIELAVRNVTNALNGKRPEAMVNPSAWDAMRTR